MTGLFSPSANKYYANPVQVYMDVTDLKEVQPCLIYQKVDQVIMDEGHGPWFQILFYCKENTLPKDLIDEYRSMGLEIRVIPQVNKETILNLMLARTLFWIMHHYESAPMTAASGPMRRLVLQPARVLLISKNIEDSNLSIVRTRLEKSGCLVAVGHPETLFSWEVV